MKLFVYLLISFCLFSPLIAQIFSGVCNSYDREKLNEGYKTCVYKDTKGKKIKKIYQHPKKKKKSTIIKIKRFIIPN